MAVIVGNAVSGEYLKDLMDHGESDLVWFYKIDLSCMHACTSHSVDSVAVENE